MIFKETNLQGAFVIEPEMLSDKRGAFARIFCQKEFEDHGLNPNISQCSISINSKKFTLRGMHFQKSPYEEAKLIHCSRGLIYDVIVDLRPNSSTYMGWTSVEMSMDNKKMVYVPEGFAHGFQSLEDNSEIIYQVSEFYTPNSELGIHWNDPEFNITWPIEEKIITEKDNSWKLFNSDV